MVALNQSLFPPAPVSLDADMWQVLQPLLVDEDNELGIYPMYSIRAFSHRFDMFDEAKIHEAAHNILIEQEKSKPEWGVGVFYEVPISFRLHTLKLRLMCMVITPRDNFIQ